MALRPTSDLGSLMQKALEDYNDRTKDLERDTSPGTQARSMQDVEAYVKCHVDDFKHFRHNGTKFDVLRTAIGNNLGQIQGMSNVLSGPTTAAFPAAAPIFTAINFLVFTGNRVRADYDSLMDFLDEVGSCMNSISIVEGFVHTGRVIPQLDEDFKKVFSAVLTLCGISTRYMKDGRLKRGLFRGVFGDDRGLNDAYIRLQKAMAGLGRSIANGSFTGIVIITAAMSELQDQVRTLESLARETKDIVKDIRDDLKDQSMPNPRRIRVYFEGFAPWQAAFDERKKKFVPGTAQWLLEKDQVYANWYGEHDKTSWGRGSQSLLWIWGGTGTGKSMLAFKVVDSLTTYASEFRGISVAYFFLPPSEKKVSLKSALHSLIVQIADNDELYCKRIANVIKELKETKPESISTVETFKKFLAEQYAVGSSRGKLYIVLDSIEELSVDDQKSIQEILGQIVSEKLNIKIILFGQSELNDKFAKIGNAEVPHIEVTTQRLDEPIKLFIDDRVGKFEFTLEDDLKNQIVETLSTNIGGFAFVNASLDEIEASGDQVEDIPDVLKHLPSTYKDLLKRVMDRTLRNLAATKANQDRLKAIKILLYWCALGRKYLTVKELRCILAMKTKYSNFNVVAEIKKSCAGLLLLSNEMDEKDEDPFDEDKADRPDGENVSATRIPRKTDNEIYSGWLVKFREFRFEECFNEFEWTSEVDSTLIENSNDAQLEVALTTMRVLSCPKSDPHFESIRDLEKYSATFWDDNLSEVHLDKATNEQIASVVKATKEVFTTPETTTLAIERQDIKMYDTFTSARVLKHEPDEEIGMIMEWYLRAQQIGNETLRLPVADFAWMESIIASPPKLFTPLGEEHVRHWLKVVDITTAHEKYEFALSAFVATEAISRNSDDSQLPVDDEIIQISEMCPGYEMEENAYRAVGATLVYNGFVDKAVEYFLKAKEHSKTPLGKFYTLVALGRAYDGMGKHGDAEEQISEALMLEEKVLLEKEDPALVKKMLRMAYKTLGGALWALSDDPNEKDSKRAIHAFEQAILFSSEDETVSANVALLDQIFRILLEVKNPKETVDKVCSWDKNLLSAWIYEDLEYETCTQAEFQRAAKLEGREDDMIKCYKTTIENISVIGDRLLIQVEYASMHWKVLEDEDLAHEELRQIMDSDDMSQNGKQARHRASLLLSEMMYGRIKLSPTVWVRRILANNLAIISQKDTESELDIWNIRPNISLAAAYLRSNQRQKAAELLDSTFALCVEWLTDDISWNDSQSLRLLARLLGCVGLQKDAETACSAVWSKLEKDLEPAPEPELEAETKNDVEEVNETVAKPEPELKPEMKSTLNNGTVTKPAENSTDVIPAENEDANDSIPATEDQSVLKSSETLEAETENTAPEEIEKTPEKIQEELFNLNRLIPEDSEDRNSGPMNCNGCSKSFCYWVKEEPFYMCLICQNMDLCKDCLAKRMEDGSGAKLYYCGINHDYVKAPTEGWGGMKDGMMSLNGEKLEFRHWLKDVEERWELWKETGKVDDAKA